MRGARCGMFGHRWDLYADADDRAVTIQKCGRCGSGRRIRWNLGANFWKTFEEKKKPFDQES